MAHLRGQISPQSMRVHIAPAALAEAEDARNWYDAVRVGLGEEFLEELDRGLRQIVDFPTCLASRRTARQAISALNRISLRDHLSNPSR